MNANPSLPAETHIGAVSLAVTQLERSLRFYQRYLGFHVIDSTGSMARLGTEDGGPLLVLNEQPNARPRMRRSTGLYHFAILHPSRFHLARTLRQLVDMGYPLQGASDHLVSEAIYLADPDDNGIEIYADRPRESWPRRAGAIQMSTEPLDVENLMAELNSSDGPWQGLPAGTTVGHVHLHVDDLDRAQTFYCGLLGFDLVLRYGPSALFVSAGGYHHHIGLNTWAGVGAPPPPADAVGLRYYEIVLPGGDHWLGLIERLQTNNTPFQNVEDGIALRDPAGNGIRLLTR